MKREQIFRSPRIVPAILRSTTPVTLIYNPTAPWAKLLVEYDDGALTIMDGDGIEFAMHGKVWNLRDDGKNIFISHKGQATMLPIDAAWEYELQ